MNCTKVSDMHEPSPGASISKKLSKHEAICVYFLTFNFIEFAAVTCSFYLKMFSLISCTFLKQV